MTAGQTSSYELLRKYSLVVAFFMMWLIWVDQARDESRWTPRSLNEVTLGLWGDLSISVYTDITAGYSLWWPLTCVIFDHCTFTTYANMCACVVPQMFANVRKWTQNTAHNSTSFITNSLNGQKLVVKEEKLEKNFCLKKRLYFRISHIYLHFFFWF